MDSRRFKKFGAYRDDLEAFAFARVGSEEDQRSVEAEIMDIADDIAYAVHDLDDFFRAGSIPLDSLRNGAADKGAIDRIFEDWTAPHEGAKVAQAKAHEDSIRRMLASLPVDGPYGGTFGERQELQWMTSTLIGDFIGAVTLSLTDGDNSILVEPQRLAQIHFLQQLVWGYVITNPRLKTQHARQRSVISDLFEIYRVAIDRKQLVLLPPTFRDEARALDRPNGRAQAEAVTRLAVDIVASLGDTQAIRIHQRLSGTALSSVSDLIDG